MQVRFLQQFLKTESAGGLFLLISAGLAIILANSSYSVAYNAWVQANLFVVNEILIAVFFLVVGLELKREFATTDLTRAIRLSAIAALGGICVPALLYFLINFNSTTRVGWAIPVATDIAFALGILSLFGKSVPTSLKIFLMSLAIFDDIGAILIIALFYTPHFSLLYFTMMLLVLGLLFLCNRIRCSYYSVYLILGILLWYTTFLTGIHPTISGILLALFIPLINNRGLPMLSVLEKRLHPWVVFGIMPLFAFCNAGFTLSFEHFAQIASNPLMIGTIIGLFLGKQLGVFGCSYLVIRAKWASLPKQVTWLSLYGTSLLCGIGFTMSLFLGTLAFSDHLSTRLDDVRMSVLLGSLLSATAGVMILRVALLKKRRSRR